MGQTILIHLLSETLQVVGARVDYAHHAFGVGLFPGDSFHEFALEERQDAKLDGRGGVGQGTPPP